MNILGFELERKVDFIAVIALVISILSAIPQVYSYFRGPEVRILPLDLVDIASIPPISGGNEYIRLFAKLSYINFGNSGHDDFILQERAQLRIGSRVLHFEGANFVREGRENGEYYRIIYKEYEALTLQYAKKEQHITYFIPEYDVNKKTTSQINTEEFVDLLKEQQFFYIDFISEMASGNYVEQTCEISVAHILPYFAKDKDVRVMCMNTDSIKQRYIQER